MVLESVRERKEETHLSRERRLFEGLTSLTGPDLFLFTLSTRLCSGVQKGVSGLRLKSFNKRFSHKSFNKVEFNPNTINISVVIVFLRLLRGSSV